MGMFGLLLALAVATGTGWLMLGVIVPGSQTRWLRLALAPTLGVAIHSLASFAWVLLLRDTTGSFWLAEAALLAGAGAAWWARTSRGEPESGAIPRGGERAGWGPLVGVALAAVAVWLAAAAVWGEGARKPHGGWDAWAMWNVKGLVLYHAIPALPLLFTEEFSHADYPLLQPLALARFWRYFGGDSWMIPLLFAVLVTVLTPLTAGVGVAAVRGVWSGCVATAAVLASLFLIRHGATQYADNTLVLMMTAAVIAWVQAVEADDGRARAGWFAVTGLVLGAAAWTKNEGAAFAVVMLTMTAVWLAWARPQPAWRSIAACALGGAPFLLAWGVHRGLLVTGGNDLIQQGAWDAVAARLGDPERYVRVGRAARAAWGQVGDPVTLGLLAGAALLGYRRDWTRLSAGLLVLLAGVLQLLVYAAVYVALSPRLSWHLVTSSDRTAMHVWPILVIGLVLCLPAGAAQANSAERPRYSPKDESS